MQVKLSLGAGAATLKRLGPDRAIHRTECLKRLLAHMFLSRLSNELKAEGARLEKINMKESSVHPVGLELEHTIKSSMVSHSAALGWGPYFYPPFPTNSCLRC